MTPYHSGSLLFCMPLLNSKNISNAASSLHALHYNPPPVCLSIPEPLDSLSCPSAIRSRNCDGYNWGVNQTTSGLTITNCQPCPLGMVTSTNRTAYPVSSSYYVDNGDGTGGFISRLACVTQPGYGINGTRALPCAAGTYNGGDNYDACTACTPPLITAGEGSGTGTGDCGIPAGYGYHGGTVKLCPIGECWLVKIPISCAV